MAAGIQIQGLAEFRAALRKTSLGTTDATAAMKRVGAPVLAKARGYAPKGGEGTGDKHPGQLAGSGKILAGGTKGRVVFPLPYAAGAEFGRYKRWAGFDRWGSPPRYGYRALNEEADNVAKLVEKEFSALVSVDGWFHP